MIYMFYICIYVNIYIQRELITSTMATFIYINTQVQIQTKRHTAGEANLTK